MKLNRVWLAAAAATVLAGSLAVAGCASTDGNDDAATEQASVTGNQGAETASNTPADIGVTNFAGHGRGGYGHAGAGRGLDSGTLGTAAATGAGTAAAATTAGRGEGWGAWMGLGARVKLDGWRARPPVVVVLVIRAPAIQPSG